MRLVGGQERSLKSGQGRSFREAGEWNKRRQRNNSGWRQGRSLKRGQGRSFREAKE
jgi:hypothetical protein